MISEANKMLPRPDLHINPKLGGKPPYVPTGRLATKGMLDLLAYRLMKKGYRVFRIAQN